ncbi:MAG: diaminopimelate epimerase [Bacteroidales bacterium]|nr:diaminopimelate epimerase [Bacteroidales bacterium]
MPELHKYSGAGNDFVVLDGRSEDVSAFRTPECIAALCDRKSGFLPAVAQAAESSRRAAGNYFSGRFAEKPISAPPSAAGMRRGADGLMILTDDPEYDFRMEFYNPDGSGGMMCGNGGRCIVAFADALGLKPRDGRVFRFQAADGPHTAEILAREGARKTVRLRMIDVHTFYPALDGWFVDTGTRHFVRFVPDADAVDVEEEGRQARWDPVFAPVGANANFVSVDPDGTLRVRTFEKGVEGETLACGTGITASAIAAYLVSSQAHASELDNTSADSSLRAGGPSFAGHEKSVRQILGHPCSTTPAHESAFGVSYDIQARIDRLAVEFRPLPDGSGFTDVYLTGPAEEGGA